MFQYIAGYVMCQVCHTFHPDLDALNAHYTSAHPTPEQREKTFKCEQCGKMFTTKGNLKRHIKQAHE